MLYDGIEIGNGRDRLLHASVKDLAQRRDRDSIGKLPSCLRLLIATAEKRGIKFKPNKVFKAKDIKRSDVLRENHE